MKKRTILSLAIVAMVFTAIAFYIQKEAIAEIQNGLPQVTIYTTDGKYHAGIEVYLVNLTTSEMTLIPVSKAPGHDPGQYPMIHAGGGTGVFHYNSTDNFLVHVCGGGWGVNSSIFHMPNDNIRVTADNLDCVPYSVE